MPNINKIPTERFREKQKIAYINSGNDLTKMPLKPNCYWEIRGDEILCFTTCVECKIVKERTTEHFPACNVTKGIEQWFTRSLAGCENLANAQYRPCNQCCSKRTKNLRCTNSEAYFKNISTLYTNITYDNIMTLWDNMTSGYITGIPKVYMRPFRNHDLAPGVHDLQRRHWKESEKYSQSNHTIENTCLDLAIANVQQLGKISDLRLAYIDVYNHELKSRLPMYDNDDEKVCNDLVKWFNKTPKENGVTARRRHDQKEYQGQRRKLDLNYILGAMIGDHNKTDKQKARDNVVPKKSIEYLNILLKYNVRCAISGMRLTIKQDLHTDLSFDRINNNLSHIIDNIRPVCIMFQVVGTKHLSRKQYLHMCLIQVHVAIPETILANIKSDHDNLNEYCAFCNLDDE
jgi:hypothetical protein